ncbi:GNAT family N-acetyltransferase [Kitasatospora viridis]|uniref:N-acetylglutamate synthase-like GNAT family acetyltransferase n=1 Tax=Kitasatospora viridis TaxID=281105 RepID=A0A561TWN0_9ACTN|nr:GNAT family N-acetyltransferase [Kitasatospora viridis]TWF91513.1 N-acetylglutamate synthase-like GNAT family acetyltransferase [Kitasatospora viridis]
MSIVVRSADLATEADEIAKLLVDYLTAALEELRVTFGIEDSPTDVSATRASLRTYEDPSTVLLVAEDEAHGLVGVAGLRTIAPGVVEVKRMYVVPDFRGLRVGAQLLDRLLDEAEWLGASTVRLDTARFMADAQGLYRSRGFAERAAYPGSEIPPHLQQYWIFFERSIEPTP